MVLPATLAAVGGFRRQEERALAPRQSAIGEINVGDGAARNPTTRGSFRRQELSAPTPRQNVIGEINMATQLPGIIGGAGQLPASRAKSSGS